MSVEIKYKGNTIASANTDTTKTLKTSGKYCEGDIEVVNTQDGGITPTGSISITENGTYDVTDKASAVVNVSGGASLPIELELIGTETMALQEYTNQNVTETITTSININNTNYAYILTTIECDGTPEGEHDWGGISIALGGRNKGNTLYQIGLGAYYYRGSKVLSYSDILPNDYPLKGEYYGVSIGNNLSNIQFTRRANANACPKIMGGNYTVNVYGIVGV